MQIGQIYSTPRVFLRPGGAAGSARKDRMMSLGLNSYRAASARGLAESSPARSTYDVAKAYGQSEALLDRIPQKTLGKNDFLQLLVTQLRYSSIDQGGGSTEYVTQMAQFSTLEQLQNVASGIEALTRIQWLSQGAALVGRTVKAIHPETGVFMTGKVTAARFVNGRAYVAVGDVDVPLEQVVEVR